MHEKDGNISTKLVKLSHIDLQHYTALIAFKPYRSLDFEGTDWYVSKIYSVIVSNQSVLRQ